jgi:hypothetical protein
MELDSQSQFEAMKTLCNLTIRVLIKGLDVSPSELRIQVTSEEDVQLYY